MIVAPFGYRLKNDTSIAICHPNMYAPCTI